MSVRDYSLFWACYGMGQAAKKFYINVAEISICSAIASDLLSQNWYR